MGSVSGASSRLEQCCAECNGAEALNEEGNELDTGHGDQVQKWNHINIFKGAAPVFSTRPGQEPEQWDTEEFGGQQGGGLSSRTAVGSTASKSSFTHSLEDQPSHGLMPQDEVMPLYTSSKAGTVAYLQGGGATASVAAASLGRSNGVFEAVAGNGAFGGFTAAGGLAGTSTWAGGGPLAGGTVAAGLSNGGPMAKESYFAQEARHGDEVVLEDRFLPVSSIQDLAPDEDHMVVQDDKQSPRTSRASSWSLASEKVGKLSLSQAPKTQGQKKGASIPTTAFSSAQLNLKAGTYCFSGFHEAGSLDDEVEVNVDDLPPDAHGSSILKPTSSPPVPDDPGLREVLSERHKVVGG